MSDPGFSIGGRSRTDFYRIAVNETSDGYDVLTNLTDVVAAAPDTGDIAWSGVLIAGTDVQPQEDGTIKMNLEQYDAGSDIYAFLDKVAVPATTIARPEVKLENGVKYGGSSGSGGLVLAVTYLQYDNDDTPTKIFTYYSIGRLAPTSGQQKTDGDNYVQPTVEYTSISATYAVSVAAAMFQAGLVTVAAPKTIAAGKAFVREFLTKAA